MVYRSFISSNLEWHDLFVSFQTGVWGGVLGQFSNFNQKMKYLLLSFSFLILVFSLSGCKAPKSPSESTSPSNVHFEKSPTGLTAMVGDRPVFTFNTSTLMPPEGLPAYYQRSGFIHPLFSPSGQILTDDFPVDHAHQHGIFLTWVNTTFKGAHVDFWNQQNEEGTVRLVEVIDTISGSDYGQLKVRLEHLSLKDGPALQEEWTITVHNTKPHFLIDFESVQQTAGADTLMLNPYHYGGFAYRGSKVWNPADSVHYQGEMQVVTSLGNDRPGSNHTRPEWIAAYGDIDGQAAGLAVFDHPDNFRFPQFVRVHPEMPYFCFPPTVEEGFTIAPGDQYVSRYRLLVFSGEPKKEEIDKFWESYRNASDK